MINLFHPYIPEDAIAEVTASMRSRWIAQGPKVNQFESNFCKKFGVNNAVSVNSGTSALETAYDLIGLGRGDEVIVPVLTCTATNLPLLARGVNIVFADILEKTLCIDPLDVRSKITTKTKAIVQVHLGGIKADCGYRNHIPVISDAAQALGIFNGDITCCSFQAIKHITTGDGGMVVCNDDKMAKKAKLIRWFGIDRDKKPLEDWQTYRERLMTYDVEVQGYKRHMNDLAAGMGLAGLKVYDQVIARRKEIHDLYQKFLYDVPGIRFVDGPNNTCWLFTVLVDRREDFARKMYECGIETNVVQVRNDVYKIFGGKRQDLPTMNEIEDKYLSLPMGMHVTDENVEYICEQIERGW